MHENAEEQRRKEESAQRAGFRKTPHISLNVPAWSHQLESQRQETQSGEEEEEEENGVTFESRR